MFAFSPTMLTHGFLVTTDMANALGFTAAVGALWMLLHRVSIVTVLATWLALSCLFLSKFSAPAFMPMSLLLVAIRLWNPARTLDRGNPGCEIHGRLRQLVIFVALSSLLMLGVVLSIWASFGFRYAMINTVLDTAETSVPWHEVETTSSLVNRVVRNRPRPSSVARGVLVRFCVCDPCLAGIQLVFQWRMSALWLGEFFPLLFCREDPPGIFRDLGGRRECALARPPHD